MRSQEWESLPEEDIRCRLIVLGLHWDKDAGAIICISCQYALQTKGERVSKHLGERHDIPAKARKGLSAFMKHLSLPDPNQLDLRRDHCMPHAHFAIQTGAACRQCDYLSTSLELVRRHMSKIHRCKSDRKHWLRDNIDTDVRLQSGTSNGARGYWVIQGKAGPADAIPNPDCSPPRRQQVTAMHEEETRRLAERFNNHAATDTESMT